MRKSLRGAKRCERSAAKKRSTSNKTKQSASKRTSKNTFPKPRLRTAQAGWIFGGEVGGRHRRLPEQSAPPRELPGSFEDVGGNDVKKRCKQNVHFAFQETGAGEVHRGVLLFERGRCAKLIAASASSPPQAPGGGPGASASRGGGGEGRGWEERGGDGRGWEGEGGANNNGHSLC